jgi:hypothetical protein
MFKCTDCLGLKGEPTLIRKEVIEWSLTGHVYRESFINKNKCEHKNFTVDGSTEEYHERASLGGTFIGMLTAHWIESKDYYIKAIATCDRCGSRFYVECSYTTENKWENYQQKKIVNRGEWTVVYETIDEKKSSIAYVK